MNLRERIVKSLQGHKVKLDVALKGMSGIEHKFDIVVEAEEAPMKIRESIKCNSSLR